MVPAESMFFFGLVFRLCIVYTALYRLRDQLPVVFCPLAPASFCVGVKLHYCFGSGGWERPTYPHLASNLHWERRVLIACAAPSDVAGPA